MLLKCVDLGVSCPYLNLPPGRGSISLCLNEFGKVPGEEFDVAVLEEDGLALALCHLVALTILTIAVLALGLRHVVSMEVLPECPPRHSGP